MGLLKKLFGGADDGAAAERGVADIGKALQLYRAGRFQEALGLADRLLADGPEVPLSWRFRAECLFSLGRHDEAVTAFERAMTIGGKGTEDLFLWIALALHNGGHPDEAKERLRRALATNLPAELRGRTEDAMRKLGGTP